MTNTHLKRRGAVYHFRLRVPADLAALIGRPELARSLKTADPALARRLGAAASHCAHRLFADLRDNPGMSPDQINALVRRFHETELNEYRELAILASFSPRAAERKGIEDRHRPNYLRMLAGDLANDRTLLVQALAEEIIEREGLTIERNSDAYRALCKGLLRGWIDALRKIEAGEIDITDTALLPPAPAPSTPAAAPAAAPVTSMRALSPDGLKTLSELLPDFLKKRGLSSRTEKEVHVAVRMVEEFFGGPKPIAEISKHDMIRYRRLLEDAPANATQRFPGLTLPEAVATNKKRAAPFPTMGAKVISDKWVAHLKTILNWAVSEGAIPDNPAAGVKIEQGKAASKRDARDPFSPAQLNAIFGAPLFTQDPASRDHRFWTPLFALFTGARPSELAQMELTDVVERDGVLCLNVTERSDEEDGGAKSLKTANARRLIPVHPELVRIGVLAYIARLRASGANRLFPTWEKGADGGFISTFPRWFNRTFLPAAGAKTTRTVFYSFRHNFRDAMRAADINREVQDALFGHADQSTGGIYGSGARAIPVTVLNEAMKKIRYDGLDLSHLHVNTSASC